MSPRMIANLFEDFPGFGRGRLRRVAKIQLLIRLVAFY